jgi:hypothetical protein
MPAIGDVKHSVRFIWARVGSASLTLDSGTLLSTVPSPRCCASPRGQEIVHALAADDPGAIEQTRPLPVCDLHNLEIFEWSRFANNNLIKARDIKRTAGVLLERRR